MAVSSLPSFPTYLLLLLDLSMTSNQELAGLFCKSVSLFDSSNFWRNSSTLLIFLAKHALG